jgi:hypothetical protein
MAAKWLSLRYDTTERKKYGFIPYVSRGNEKITIEFIFENGYWKQNTEEPIDDLNEETRSYILKLLNGKIYSSNIIYDSYNRLI